MATSDLLRRLDILEAKVDELRTIREQFDALTASMRALGVWTRWGLGLLVMIFLALFVQHQASNAGLVNQISHCLNTVSGCAKP